MNLTNYISDYEFNTYRRVIIGREEYQGMIIQKSPDNNIHFYKCTEFGTYNKFRIIPDEELFQLYYLETYDSEIYFDKAFYDTLHLKCKELRNDKIIDLRSI